MGLYQQILPNATQHFSVTIPQCPITVFKLVDSYTQRDWVHPRIALDLGLNQVNISTAVGNIHDQVDFYAATEAGRSVQKLITINVCGAQNITHTVNASDFEFDLDNQTQSLVLLDNLTDYTRYFNNSDPLCHWTNFTLTKLDESSGQLVPFVDNRVWLNETEQQVFLTRSAKMNETFFLNVTTLGGPWLAHKFQVFICGSEEVKVTEGKQDIKIRYWWDNSNTISGKVILSSFKSSIERCPIVSYHLAESVAEDQEPVRLKSLDSDTFTIGTDEDPTVLIDYAKAYTNYPKVKKIYILGCSLAWQCAYIKVELNQIYCRELMVASDEVDIHQTV